MTETNESLKEPLFIDEEEEKEELPPAMPEKLPSWPVLLPVWHLLKDLPSYPLSFNLPPYLLK